MVSTKWQVTKGFEQFGFPSLAFHLLVLLVICSNFALANLVSSGQASTRNIPSPPCGKPRPLAVRLNKTSMKLKDIFNHNIVKVFVVTEDDYDDELNWTIEPTEYELIPAKEDHYFVKAVEVSENSTLECYMEFKTPERVTGHVVKKDANGQLYVGNIYHQKNTIIPAIACDFPGFYDIYSAKENPQAGIDILRNDLKKATNKSAVSEELGYLLIDEERIDEAIEALKISEENTPTTRYTFLELSKLYAQKGEIEKSAEYAEKFKNHEKK